MDRIFKEITIYPPLEEGGVWCAAAKFAYEGDVIGLSNSILLAKGDSPAAAFLSVDRKIRTLEGGSGYRPKPIDLEDDCTCGCCDD